MSDLIIKREDVEIHGVSYHWMVAEDARAAGLDTCGCDKATEYPPDKIVEQKDYGNLVTVTFVHRRPDTLFHNNGQDFRWFCTMAFGHPDMKPLTFEEYMAHFPAKDDD